jgi:hypothetical protein
MHAATVNTLLSHSMAMIALQGCAMLTRQACHIGCIAGYQGYQSNALNAGTIANARSMANPI